MPNETAIQKCLDNLTTELQQLKAEIYLSNRLQHDHLVKETALLMRVEKFMEDLMYLHVDEQLLEDVKNYLYS